jgi:hypothetical protein
MHDGSADNGSLEIWVDGVFKSFGTGLALPIPFDSDARNLLLQWLLGCDTAVVNTYNFVGEMACINGLIDPQNFPLVSGMGVLNGASRTSPLDIEQFDGTVYILPAANEVYVETEPYGSVLDPITPLMELPIPGEVTEGEVYGPALVGTRTDADPDKVINTESYGADGTDFQGLYVPTPVGKVEEGFAFGPSGSLEGTLDVEGNQSREYLNGILSSIGTTSLTDDEFYSISADPIGLNSDTYDSLETILEARELASNVHTRLHDYFESRDVDVADPTTGKSNIYVGGVLE